jgi:hypothetical protein
VRKKVLLVKQNKKLLPEIHWQQMIDIPKEILK